MADAETICQISNIHTEHTEHNKMTTSIWASGRTQGCVHCLFGILVVPSQKRDAMKKAPPAQGHKALGIQIPGNKMKHIKKQLSCRNSERFCHLPCHPWSWVHPADQNDFPRCQANEHPSLEAFLSLATHGFTTQCAL